MEAFLISSLLILVLSSTTRSFAHTRVGTHLTYQSSTHTLCPHRSSKQLPFAHSQACRCVSQEDGPRGGTCPCRPWKGHGSTWTRESCVSGMENMVQKEKCVNQVDTSSWLLDCCPTEGGTAQRESEKDLLVHGSQGRGTEAWILPTLPQPFQFHLNNLTPYTLQNQNEIKEITWAVFCAKKAKWMSY